MKTTKRQLLGVLLSLLLCVTMLIGSAYAWFTDSVTGGVNRIVAGNLDIELEYLTDDGEWLPVDETTPLFDGDSLWEPGHTEVVYLKIANRGSLALQYALGVGIVSETTAQNIDGDDFLLSDHIQFGVIKGRNMPFASRKAAREAVAASQVIGTGYEQHGALYPETAAGVSEEYVALVVFMPESVGNEANYRGTTVPQITLGVDLVAGQKDYEDDSFGDDYDATVTTYAGLLDAFAAGGHIRLGADITIPPDEIAWDYAGATNKAAHLYVPAGVEVTFDLNGYTLQNTHVSSTVRHDVIANYGTMTVTDSVGGGMIVSNNNTANVQVSGGFAVFSGGDLHLKDVAIDGNTGSYTVYIEGEGNTLTVDNATVSGRGALAVYNGAHGIVNSGHFSIDVLTANSRDNVLALYNATADVFGGTFDGTLKTLGSNDDSFAWKGSSCVMLMGSTSEAHVYGGTFEAREADLFSHGAGCKVYAYGGTFNTVNVLGNSALHEHNSRALVEVSGGSFIYDPSDYLATGCHVEQTGGRYLVVTD